MYDPPGYLWAIVIIGVAAIAAAVCVVLYQGATRAGLGQRRTVLLTGGAAVLFGAWFAASAEIANQGWYQGRTPWMPLAIAGFLVTLIALGRIPDVARALSAPGMLTRLTLPHSFRVEGIVFLLYLALGHLPALFALPAGLGDIATAVAAPFIARRLARATGRRAALWFNAFGIADLVVALTLGGLILFQVLKLTPSGDVISGLPLVLVPTVGVPLLLVSHLAFVRGLLRLDVRNPLGAGTADLADQAGQHDDGHHVRDHVQQVGLDRRVQ